MNFVETVVHYLIILAPSVVASVMVSISARNLWAFKKSQQYNMINTILADLNNLEGEIPVIYQLTIEKRNEELTNVSLSQLLSRIFSKLDWLSFLVNDEQVNDESLKKYVISMIKEYYETTFSRYATEKMKEKSQYIEFKKLYETVKDKPL